MDEERTSPGRATLLLHSLLGGVVWMAVQFIGDTVDSLRLIRRSMDHVEVDGLASQLLQEAVIAFVGQVAVAHLIMAMVSGLLLYATTFVWHRRPPGGLKWWLWATPVATLVTLLGYARQISTFPTLHDWVPWRVWWVDHVTPGLATGLQIAVAVGLLAWRFSVWGRQAPGLFARRVAALAVLVLGVGLTQVPPTPPTPPDNEAAETGPYNVVLIGVDSLRPDRLSANGHDRPTSPHMDALLAESVTFEHVYTPLARTYPAWTSTLTGVWPTTHGIRDNLPAPHELVPELPTLPQVLQDTGYYTAFTTDDSRFSYMVPEIGWDEILQPPVGLKTFAISANEPRYRMLHGFMHNPLGYWLVPSMKYNQAYGKSYRPWLYNDGVVRMIDRAATHERFFVAMHSCVLHHPGDRNWPYSRMWDQEGYSRANRFRYARSPTTFEVSGTGSNDRAELYATQDERIYDSGIVMADELVGDVMTALREGDLLDDTIVILFSDHGEELWAPELPYRYGGPNHGFHLMGDAQNRVMFSIRFPDGRHAGETVQDPASLVDLGPGIAELLGIPWPGETDAEPLTPLLEGTVPDADPPRLIYMETGVSEKRYWVPGHRDYPFRRVQERYDVDVELDRIFIREEFRPHLVAGKDRAVQVGRWKLVWHAMKHGTRYGLYDIAEDPYQRNDLARQNGELVDWLGARLVPFLVGDGENNPVFMKWQQSPAEPPPALLGDAPTEADPSDVAAPPEETGAP